MKRGMVVACMLCGLSLFCGCLEGPTGPQGLPGSPAETPEYYLTALSGNGRTAKANSLNTGSLSFSVLVANLHGVPIRSCRIDWTIIEGDVFFMDGSEKVSEQSTHTSNIGETGVSVYSNSVGRIKVRATAFASGEYVDFIGTFTEL